MLPTRIKFFIWRHVHQMPWRIIRGWQNHHLKKLLKHAYSNVELYSELWKSPPYPPTDTRTPLSILTHLPLVPRSAFAYRKRESFIAPAHTWNGLYEWAFTSGTTGEPRAILRSVHGFEPIRNTFLAYQLWRFLDWTDDTTVNATHTTVLQLYDDAYDAHPTHPHVPFFKLNEDPRRYLSDIAELNARVVQGYPTHLVELAKLRQKYNFQDTINFSYIVTSGEPLFESQRTFLTEHFECDVYNRYGMEETFWTIGVECSYRRGFHPYHEAFIFEVVNNNGEPTAPETSGKIVITDLFNYASPLIRYDTGDIGYWRHDHCPCGLAGNTLVIEGRDQVLSCNGNTLHYNDINRVTAFLANAVLQWQIAKTSKKSIDIRLVKGPQFEESLVEMLENLVQRKLGEDVEVRTSFHIHIPTSSTGKVSFFVDEVGAHQKTPHSSGTPRATA